MKSYVWLLAVFLVFLIAGCSSDVPTVSENDGQAQLAPYYNPVDYNYKITQINQLILAEAARQNGTATSKSCKEWVQSVVLKAVSKSIPPNDTYALYQWLPSSTVKIVWQVKFACVGSFSADLKPGQIMQIKWRYPYMSGGPHTIILQSVSAASISYYEANAGPVVRLWTTSISKWQQIADSWTVYQVLP